MMWRTFETGKSEAVFNIVFWTYYCSSKSNVFCVMKFALYIFSFSTNPRGNSLLYNNKLDPFTYIYINGELMKDSHLVQLIFVCVCVFICLSACIDTQLSVY